MQVDCGNLILVTQLSTILAECSTIWEKGLRQDEYIVSGRNILSADEVGAGFHSIQSHYLISSPLKAADGFLMGKKQSIPASEERCYVLYRITPIVQDVQITEAHIYRKRIIYSTANDLPWATQSYKNCVFILNSYSISVISLVAMLGDKEVVMFI